MISNQTVYDLIYMALRECGIASQGDTIDDAIMQEALLDLNALRVEWSIASKDYALFDETMTAATNRTNITLGTDGTTIGDIATRPSRIEQVTLISGAPGVGVNYQLAIEPYSRYRTVPLTNVMAVPHKAYVDNSFPIQNIWFYPGLSTGWSIRVIGIKYLEEYESLSDTFSDPPEYFKPLYLALALNTAPKYGIDLASGTVIRANDAIKHIKANLFMRSQAPMPNGLTMRPDNGYNFFSGRV
jgi:hypothetical protein